MTLLESSLGGVLCPVDFIYSEPGVNRPLTPDDEEKKNLNQPRYQNQVNKVANAVLLYRGFLKPDKYKNLKDPDGRISVSASTIYG